MSEIIEAVARALCQCDEQDGSAPWDWYAVGAQDKFQRDGHERYRQRAHAAAEAVRERILEVVSQTADLYAAYASEGRRDAVTRAAFARDEQTLRDIHMKIDAVLNEVRHR